MQQVTLFCLLMPSSNVTHERLKSLFKTFLFLCIITHARTDARTHGRTHESIVQVKLQAKVKVSDRRGIRRPGHLLRPTTQTPAPSPVSADQHSTQSRLRTPRRNRRLQTPRICCCHLHESAPAPNANTHTHCALSLLFV